jgi:serine protease Do
MLRITASSLTSRYLVALVFACTAGLTLLPQPSPAADEIKTEMTAAVQAVRPALIRILVVSAEYDQGREVKTEASGSGIIISPEGYAVTNHHVAGNAERLVCTLADRREVDAKLVGTDPLADIAVIKLISPDGKPFPIASFGDSSKVEVGDRVYAMGCPYALSQSVTNGIISNTEMVMPGLLSSNEFTLEGEDVGSIVRWIGHDALIRPGNSGGPLVDRQGLVIGINEISVGLSGAIPGNLAKEVSDKLIRTGKVVRSWLGIEVQPLLRSSTVQKGILVSGVLDGSPASKAGLQSGDILVSLGGHDTTARFREQLPLFNQFVADIPVGKPIKALLLRGSQQMLVELTPTERQSANDKEREIKSWGICGSNITYLDQKEMELDSQDGVAVTGVLPSGPAGSAKPALAEGDIIKRVGNEAVKDITALRAITKKLTDGKTDPVPVLVSFDQEKKHLVTVVKIGKIAETNPGAEISKAWLPVDTQVLTHDLAEALGVAGKTGVRITRVYPNSSAATAGLKVGDLILKLDAEDIPAEQVEDEEVLPSMIRQYDVGATAKLKIVREGKPLDISVKLETSPKLSRDYPRYDDQNFEFTARDIAFADKANGAVRAKQAGAFVESVSEGSWAALADLAAGNVIAEIDGKPISGLADLKAAMAAIAKSKPKTVVFKVENGVHTRFVEIQPSWPDAGQ